MNDWKENDWKESGIDPADFTQLDPVPPEGIERAVAWICGLEHVRETIPFPRMLHRLYP